MATIARRSGGTVAALLLGASFLYRQTALPNEKPPAPLVTTSPSQKSLLKNANSAEEGPWKPFCEHDNVRLLSQWPAETARAKQRAEGVRQKWADCKPISPISFIVATVPDPEQTHLSLDFDRYVESIAWAVSDSDYSLENYWFPWQAWPEKEETDPEKRKAAIQDRELRLQMPGVMLFRKKAEAEGEELLAVFLIGERPTFGVNRVALRVALDAMQIVAPAYRRVYMVGPSFSGSLPRLRQLLSDPKLWANFEPSPPSKRAKSKGKAEPKAKAHQKPKAQQKPIVGPNLNQPRPFTIISGQTTSTEELKEFGSGTDSTLKTTVNDDNYAIHQFLSYLPSPDSATEPDIALLSEDETAYGHDLQGPPRTPPGKHPQDETLSRVLMVRYPRGIARLRNTVNEVPNVGSASPSAPGDRLADLPLVLKEMGEDTLRSFSQQQTPLSSQAVLVNMAGMVRRNKIKYVGVLATDPLDTLFLVRFLHVACPDVQLVVFTSDLLFARVAHAWSIEGMLAVTTYPLIIENQDFMKPQDPPRRVVFPSAYSEGVYNATHSILRVIKPKIEDRRLDYSSPKGISRCRPPLWLTILGHDSFWPIALLNGQQPVKGQQPPQPTSAIMAGMPPGDGGKRALPETPSVLWQTIFGLVSLYSVVVVLTVFIMNLCAGTKVGNWLRGFAFARNFSLSSGQNSKASGAANLYIILATLAIANALFLLTIFGLQSMWIPMVCCTIIVLFASVESMWVTCVLFRSNPNWDAKALITFSLVLSIVCAIALLCTRTSLPAVHMMDFFAYRSLHPESGVSPILPALILAIGYQYWPLIQLRRLRWIEECRPSTLEYPCVCRSAANQSGRHAADGEGKPWFVQPSRLQQEEIESIFGSRTAVTSLPFSILWLLLFWPPTHINSIEPFSYRVFLAILLVVMYAMLIGNWIRFLFLWKDLSRMLHGLESHALRAAFSRLPSDFSWRSVWMGSLGPQMITLTRSYDCLCTLKAWGIDLLLTDQLKKLSASVYTIEKEQQSDESRYGPAYFAAFNTIENSYSCAAYEAATRLKADWLKGSSDSVVQHEKTLVPTLLPIELQTKWALEEFLALRYVAYIRYVFQQMRNFLEFLTTGFILLAIATVAYPFQGHHAIATAHLILFGVLGAGVVVAFLSMDRDPLLSRLNGSRPNEVGLDVIWRVLSYGLIPLLSLLGSQFPSVREFLFSWVQPALQAVK